MNETLQKTTNDILEALKTGVEQYGPKALELALNLKRVEGIGALVGGFAAIIVALAIAAFLKKTYTKSDGFDSIDSPEVILFLILLGVVGFFIFAFGLASFLNIWNWTAVFSPELALAHDILKKIVGTE